MATGDGVPRLSVVIPVRNDAPALARLLSELAPFECADLEVVVVDGGSSDDPEAAAAPFQVRLLRSEAGRGRQLSMGVAAARGPWLWLLHADSSGVAGPLGYLLARARADIVPCWGRFDVVFAPDAGAFRLIAFMMNQRSRLSGICTGDQGMFAHRSLLEQAGGIPRQPLMEDIELSRRLRNLCRPVARSETLTTSSRRWQQRGVVRTVLGMWSLRLRYWLGADPDVLAREYYR